MFYSKRKSLSEINLSKDLTSEHLIQQNDAHNNVEKIYKNQTKVNFNLEDENNVRELTASSLLYNKVKSSARAISNDYQTDNIPFFNHTAKRSLINQFSRKNARPLKTKRLKCEIYNLLERPSGNFAFIYRLFTFSLILAPIIFNALTTIQPVSVFATRVLLFIETFVTFYFFLEFCLRVWSSGYRGIYQGVKGRIKFCLRPIMIIEFLAFVLGCVVLSISYLNHINSSTKLHEFNLTTNSLIMLRFSQLIRLLYVDRKADTWNLLLDVISKHKLELITGVYIGFIILLTSSYLIFICEKEANQSFRTYSDAVYWSIITMTTIGYGDISPKTFYGKIIATGLCILGVAFWTLPGGIIGSGFALKVEQKNKREQFNRLVPAAASLIQTWWRLKVIYDIPTDNTSRLVAVLKVFEAKASSTNKEAKNKKISNFNTQTSNESQQNFMQNHKLLFDLDPIDSSKQDENGNSSGIFAKKSEENEQFLNELNMFRRYYNEREIKNREYIDHKLKPQTIVLLRVIFVLKFFVSKRKFKFAHKPYDFKDVIEQYTQGNMDILLKIKELQRKLDHTLQFQKPSYSKLTSFRSQAKMNYNEKKDESSDKKQYLSVNNETIPSISTSLNDNLRNTSTLEARIDAIEAKLDFLVNIMSNKNSN